VGVTRIGRTRGQAFKRHKGEGSQMLKLTTSSPENSAVIYL
jgi:hypothetical protein